jgi:exocyst complex component 5
MVLEKAGSISSLAFLRALQSSRSYISALVEDFKSHGLTEHPEPTSAAVTATLDQQLEDLFVPYFSGSSYIEREKKNLDELYSSLLFKFITYHVSLLPPLNVQSLTNCSLEEKRCRPHIWIASVREERR